MPPKQQKKAQKKPKKTQPNPPKQRGLAALDPGARDYARLLNDPCYGKITAPIFDSVGTGNYVRVEADFILGAEATSVGCAVIFTPGLLTPSSSLSGTRIPTTVVNSDAAAIVWAESYANQCGAGFRANCGAVRAIAGCLQATYLGPEQTRAGICALMQTSMGNASQYNTVGGLRSASDRVMKIPDETVEIKLIPAAKNADFISCDTTAKADALQLPSLVYSCSGIPVSTGIRIRLVQILEWMPFTSVGVVNTTSGAESRATLSAVLAEMHKRNPSWQYELLGSAAQLASKAAAWL